MLRNVVSTQINGIIASYRANILAAYDSIIEEGKEADCFAIQERQEHAAGSSRMFLAEFSKYCDKRQKESGVRIYVTANKYHRLLRYMTEYTKEQYKQEVVPLDFGIYGHIDDLNIFMQTAHQCKNNGAVYLLCCLKNFILYAIRNEWIEKNPFRYYKMKIDKTNVKVPLAKKSSIRLSANRCPTSACPASATCLHSAAILGWLLPIGINKINLMNEMIRSEADRIIIYRYFRSGR